MQAARRRKACRIGRIGILLIAACCALAVVSPTLGQTKSRKKSAAAETPAPKQKAPPPESPEAVTEEKESRTGGFHADAKSKGSPSPSSKADKPEEPAESTSPKSKTRKPKEQPTDSSSQKAKTTKPEAEPKESPAQKSKVSKPEPEIEPEVSPTTKSPAAPNAAIAPEEILEFRAQPAGVKKLIESCLELARQNLTYSFGSADPANGGMDCSGFIYYALRQHGLTQVPRDSSNLYVWVRKAHAFRAVISRKPDSFEMDELLPGDLLFWIGTYVTDHDPPVTHAMIYLGTEKATGAKIMIGSSDGRTYRGQKRNGVSVFDFKMPRTPDPGDQRTTFIGYARIPGLRD
jgi:cell wall-associated NlpC family hydrolase